MEIHTLMTSGELTVLFGVIIGVTVSTPGGYLAGTNKACQHVAPPSEDSEKRREDSPGSLWGCWTKGPVRWLGGFVLLYNERPSSTQRNTPDKSCHRYSPARESDADNNYVDALNSYITDDWWTLTLEYCILSTMSSLVRGMRPDRTRRISVTAAFTSPVATL